MLLLMIIWGRRTGRRDGLKSSPYKDVAGTKEWWTVFARHRRWKDWSLGLTGNSRDGGTCKLHASLRVLVFALGLAVGMFCFMRALKIEADTLSTGSIFNMGGDWGLLFWLGVIFLGCQAFLFCVVNYLLTAFVVVVWFFYQKIFERWEVG